MKKNRYDAYANYYYNYNKKSKRKTRIISLIFCMFCLGVVVFFSISFSNFLNVSKIVNNNTNFIFSNKIVYGLSLFSSSNLSDAQESSNNIKNQGGAGFIYGTNNVYFVLASVYKIENDANKVKQNLIENNVSSEVLKVELPSLNLKINLTTKSREILSEGVNLFYNNYLRLYDISSDYDLSKIDFVNTKTRIKDLYENNKVIIEKFNNHFNSSSNIYVLYLKIYLNKLNEHVKNLVDKDESVNISSAIKECYCNILSLYINLYNEII